MHRTPPSRRKAQILIWLFLFFLPSAGWAQSGFQLSVSVVPNTTCAKGTDGEIHMTLQNGLPPYQVIWEGPNGPLSASGSASSNNLSATNLISGDYFLTVTDRGGGVIKDNFFVADESDPCGQIDETITHPSSATSQDGALSLVIPFGTGSYILVLEDSQGNTVDSVFATAPMPPSLDYTNLGPSVYSLSVIDQNGCPARGGTYVLIGGLQANIALTHPSCFGQQGSASITVTIGTPPYQYLWSNGSSGSAVQLAAGNYSVTVSDSTGRFTIKSLTMTSPPEITLAEQIQNESISGYDDGAVSVSASGGVPPYTYEWSTGNLGTTLSNLSNGNYTVTVTDQVGCEHIESYNVLPGILSVSVQPNPQYGTADQLINVQVTYGVPPFAYSWSDGSTGNDIQMSPGTYTVTVTDSEGSFNSEVFTVFNTLPLGVVGNGIAESVVGANDGAAIASAINGYSPYQYLWNTGATISILNGMSPGSYSVTVTDALGCKAETTVTIVPGAPILNVYQVPTHNQCHGDSLGAVTILTTGGSPPLQFHWSDGSSDQNRSGLAAGQYTLTVSDAGQQTYILPLSINEPTELHTNLSLKS